MLVNNAGNMYRGPLAELDEQRLLEVFHSNVIGGMMLTQAALDHLVASMRRGDLHRLDALAAGVPRRLSVRRDQGRRRDAHRRARRRARSAGRPRLAASGPVPCSPRSTSAPGCSTTRPPGQRLERLAPAHALGRIGTVEEIAEAVEYLARAEWTTGGVLTVDGGLGLGVTNE